MTWEGPIKQINIELPEDMHKAVKSEFPRRGLSYVRQAYIEGMTLWLDAPVPKPEQPTGQPIEITQRESEGKAAVLESVPKSEQPSDPILEAVQSDPILKWQVGVLMDANLANPDAVKGLVDALKHIAEGSGTRGLSGRKRDSGTSKPGGGREKSG